MKFTPTELSEVIVVEPDVLRDERGFFLETYQEEKYREGGISETFMQDNHSQSSKGTLRGLHAQLVHPQGKLIRVIEGEVYDVAVDIRPNSPTFKKWVSEVLSADNFKQLYIPPGFAHGFCVTSDIAQFEYKCTDYYDPSGEITILWNDSDLNVQWPVKQPLLSEKDANAPRLKDVMDRLSVL